MSNINKPLLSICIPTYNRGKFLYECLKSITDQFQNEIVRKNVNIFILDNQSNDDTEKIAKKFVKLFDNIVYIKDSEKREIVAGIIKVAELGNGDYIWVFSDDDIQTKDAISSIIKTIKSEKADAIICNLNSFFGDMEKIKNNLLNLKVDYFLEGRGALFTYLNKKIFSNFDFYTTFCSNTLIKKEFFYQNRWIFKKFNSKLDLFPFHSLIYYSNNNITVKIISSPIIFIRGGNESWGFKNQIKHFFYRQKLWKNHYKNIISINKKYLSPLFSVKIKIKNYLEIRNIINYFFIITLKKIYLYKITKAIYYKIKKLK